MITIGLLNKLSSLYKNSLFHQSVEQCLLILSHLLTFCVPFFSPYHTNIVSDVSQFPVPRKVLAKALIIKFSFTRNIKLFITKFVIKVTSIDVNCYSFFFILRHIFNHDATILQLIP